MVNLLVPRNIEGRKEKLKQMNIKLLSQEVIHGDLYLDESFMDIDAKFVKLKKVNGVVWLKGGQWTEIPAWLKDVEIKESFHCSFNKLTTLKNCPHKIKGYVDCQYNQLTSLEGSPETVGGSFWCYNNQLTSLEGSPETVGENFSCSNNKLVSLEGCPETIGEYFSCSHNELTSLEGCPENIGGNFLCYNNKVKLKLPNYVKLEGKFIN